MMVFFFGLGCSLSRKIGFEPMGSLENVWASCCLHHRAHFSVSPFPSIPHTCSDGKKKKRKFLVRTVGAAVSRVCQLEADFGFFAILYPWLSEVSARVYSHEMDHWLWIRYLGDQG